MAILSAGHYSLRLTTPSGAYGFGCEVPGAPPADGSPIECIAASVPSGGDESATLQVSFGIEGSGPAEFEARISSPNDDPDREGDRGPDEVTIRVEFDGAQLFEETYQPEYSEQSRGRGCGSCLHEANEQATL